MCSVVVWRCVCSDMCGTRFCFSGVWCGAYMVQLWFSCGADVCVCVCGQVIVVKWCVQVCVAWFRCGSGVCGTVL